MNLIDSINKAINEYNSDALWELCGDCETEEFRYEILLTLRDDMGVSNSSYDWFSKEWINNMNTRLEMEEEAA